MTSIEVEMTYLVERIAALSRQEEEVYQCHDYLSPFHQVTLGQKALSYSRVNTVSSAVSSCSSTSSSKSGGINEVWREKICEWTFQVIDHFDFNREIASISLNYLDRYLSTCTVDRKTFQLAAMTSLFLAIKLYEPATLKMSNFVELSGGYFETKHIVDMERSILWNLSWLVHPPTPLNFVRNFISILGESGCSSAVTIEIKEVARFLTELSVCDYYFTTRKPSSTGLGALLTAFESFDEATLPSHIRNNFIRSVQSMDIIDPSSDEVFECKRRISAIYLQHKNNQRQESKGLFSPGCVADVESHHSRKGECEGQSNK